MHDVTAVLMCAGLGSRSAASKEMQVPKCLLRFGDRPFLDCLLRWLVGGGIENMVVVAHTHGTKVMQHLASSAGENDTRHVEVTMLPELRGTNWTALHGLRKVRSERALILTADTVWKIDLPHLLSTNETIDVWVPVAPISAMSDRLPNLVVDENDRVRTFGVPRSRSEKGGRLGVGLYLINSVPQLVQGLHRPGELDSTGIDPTRLSVSAYTRMGDFVDFGTDENLVKLQDKSTSWPEFFAQ